MLISLYNKINLPLRQKSGKVCLLPIIKHLGSLSLGFLSCDAKLLHTQHLPGPLCVPLHGRGKQEGSNMNMKLVLLRVLRIIKSFVSGPGVPCLLPAPMKLWQVNS